MPNAFDAELKALLFSQFRDDTERRLALLRAAQRPDEPLTDGRQPTAAGHIASAIAEENREMIEDGNDDGQPATLSSWIRDHVLDPLGLATFTSDD